jgi:hypothetical protein
VSENRDIAVTSALLMAMRDTDKEPLKELRFNSLQGISFVAFIDIV